MVPALCSLVSLQVQVPGLSLCPYILANHENGGDWKVWNRLGVVFLLNKVLTSQLCGLQLKFSFFSDKILLCFLG